MRIVPTAFVLTVLTAAIGCGSGAPAAPSQVTADEERQIQEDQKAVDAEEQGQRAARERTPEEQVEAEERGRR